MKNLTLNKEHIVVIGGGFAGLNFIQHMSATERYHITLVDKNNYNYFTPLVYQVATGFLEPSSISYPFRKLFQGRNVSFHMAAVTRVETDANLVHLSDGTCLHYDFLVFAAGTQANFFGNESVRRNALVLKGVDDALVMRNSLIRIFEKASVEADPLEKQKLLTIVIAGGGPTGVEIAGMLAELKKHILHKEYPEISVDQIRLYIIDGAPSLLAPMSERTHDEAKQILASLGIKVLLNTMVTRYENDEVTLSNGEAIITKTLIWAAGVTATTFHGIKKSSLEKGNRMITDAYHRVKEYHNVFAIGDISIQMHETDYPHGHPQLAPPAVQQGKSLAKNFVRLAKGKAPVSFKYFDRGEMAIIGREHALVDLFKHKIHFGGILGLLSWLFIHVISLVNYNNIIKTLYTWAVAYITHDQPLRMIFRTSLPKPTDPHAESVDVDEAA
ncbi:NAD(P)/FAD-dependent oxidoreductase [Chryseolinea sp. H1M3-3]|uniref:NAD(P)/FAD-dependent oxidoreductase n=1 Tax=Chryseolinea sp. H1M3-3 TaxID=3034144 RepID=UPI0023EE0B8A|nr:NAD(P)/FAD-dependent oxidoreductase [Chryseolinea sp. H1M3-3]